MFELDGERAAVIDKREIKRTFIDESGFKEIDSETVRERKQLAYEGAVTVVLTIDEQTSKLEGEPKIIARGVRGLGNENGFGRDPETICWKTRKVEGPRLPEHHGRRSRMKRF